LSDSSGIEKGGFILLPVAGGVTLSFPAAFCAGIIHRMVRGAGFSVYLMSKNNETVAAKRKTKLDGLPSSQFLTDRYET
jgi:hypothetical protein